MVDDVDAGAIGVPDALQTPDARATFAPCSWRCGSRDSFLGGEQQLVGAGVREGVVAGGGRS